MRNYTMHVLFIVWFSRIIFICTCMYMCWC